jgi:TrbL/VirB6 plasmid conjugal transfer protein
MAITATGDIFKQIYSEIVKAMSERGGLLVEDGLDVAHTLLLISLSWIILKWILTSNGATALVDAFGTLARYSFVIILLTGWMGIVGGFFQGNAVDISSKVLTGDGGGTPESVISTAVTTIMAASGRLLVSERAQEESSCSYQNPDGKKSAPVAGGVDNGSYKCSVEKQGAAGASVSWIEAMVGFPMILMTWALRLVALLLMALLLGAYLSIIGMAEVIFGSGMIIGPVLVPFLIWERTEFLFDGWLKFMIVGTLTKIVTAIMVVVVTGVIFAAKRLSDSIEVGRGMELLAVDETIAFMVCVVALIGTFLMWQVPTLAQAMVSGGAGYRGQGFSSGLAGSALKTSGMAVDGMSKPDQKADASSKGRKNG